MTDGRPSSSGSVTMTRDEKGALHGAWGITQSASEQRVLLTLRTLNLESSLDAEGGA